MKQMIYKPKMGIEILDEGTYNNYHYVIISYGTHPCAYVEIPKEHPYYKKDFSDLDIIVHGGLSFGDNLTHANIGNSDNYFLGWDYNNYDDYNGYYSLPFYKEFAAGKKKYTTEEIFEDVKLVIDQLDNLSLTK